MVFWSALRRGATRESGYQANRALLTKYKKTLFAVYGRKAQRDTHPAAQGGNAGSETVGKSSRRSMSSREKREREAHRASMRERNRDRKLDREIPHIDFEVIQKGFGFLWAMVRDPLPADEQMLRHYIRELFELEMRTLPCPRRAKRIMR